MKTKKERQKEHSHNHYLRNKAVLKDRAKAWTKETARRHRIFIKRYKLFVGCRGCGYKKCSAALEFHHIKSQEKDDHVSVMAARGVGIKRLKDEIRKCAVLCANCHRELHDAA